jgi:hypothetical protein
MLVTEFRGNSRIHEEHSGTLVETAGSLQVPLVSSGISFRMSNKIHLNFLLRRRLSYRISI